MRSTVIRSLGQSVIAAVSLIFLPAAALADDSAKVASAAGAAQGQAGTSAASGQSGTAGSGAAAPVRDAPPRKAGDGSRQKVTYLLVPLAAPEQNQWMKKGCWARLYDNQNFSGDSLTLMGPADMPDMTGPFGIDWKGKISSVETGAKARLLVYDNEEFRDLVATFKPGQKSADVSKKMGFFDEFSSLKIVCDNMQTTNAGR